MQYAVVGNLNQHTGCEWNTLLILHLNNKIYTNTCSSNFTSNFMQGQVLVNIFGEVFIVLFCKNARWSNARKIVINGKVGLFQVQNLKLSLTYWPSQYMRNGCTLTIIIPTVYLSLGGGWNGINSKGPSMRRIKIQKTVLRQY